MFSEIAGRSVKTLRRSQILIQQMEEEALTRSMNEIGYRPLKTNEHPLPNVKKCVMLDFEYISGLKEA